MMKERERVLARLYVAEDGSQQLVLLSPFAGGRSVWLYEDGTRFPFPQMKDGLYLGATEAFAGRSIHARSGRRLSAPLSFRAQCGCNHTPQQHASRSCQREGRNAYKGIYKRGNPVMMQAIRIEDTLMPFFLSASEKAKNTLYEACCPTAINCCQKWRKCLIGQI